jgi:uncharacterized protein DUF2867
MRLPNTAHTSRPWRIQELTRDFRLEDVWALPTPAGPDVDALPFTSLYLLDDEFAAEVANRTMHGVMHLGWVPDQTGGYRGQMAILVKPNGLLGTAYMAAIRPFRHLIVYLAMMREIEREWRAGAGDPTSGAALWCENGLPDPTLHA